MHILVVFALCWTNTWKNHIFQYFEWILLRQQIFTAYTLLQFVCFFQNAFKIDFLHDYQFKYLIFIKNKTIFLWKSKNSPFWDPRRQYFRNHHFYLFSWTLCYNSCKKNHLENVFSSSSQVLGKLQNMHFANSTENGWKKITFTVFAILRQKW